MTKQKEGSANEPVIETAEETAARLTASAGKGRPTPTRKEREAANKRPLVPGDRKEAKRAARDKLAVDREKARVGLAAGEERYLPPRDRGVQKKFVRDYVDARFSVGELLLPAMLVVILLSFIPGIDNYAILSLWAFFVLAIVDCVWLGFRITRKLGQKFGAENVEKVRWYASMRALQLRVLRLPKPQVKRGQYPTV